jgi:hypothetical protein
MFHSGHCSRSQQKQENHQRNWSQPHVDISCKEVRRFWRAIQAQSLPGMN